MERKFSIYNDMYHDAIGEFWEPGAERGYIQLIEPQPKPLLII